MKMSNQVECVVDLQSLYFGRFIANLAASVSSVVLVCLIFYQSVHFYLKQH